MFYSRIHVKCVNLNNEFYQLGSNTKNYIIDNINSVYIDENIRLDKY